jgi:hypothetical protein
VGEKKVFPCLRSTCLSQLREYLFEVQLCFASCILHNEKLTIIFRRCFKFSGLGRCF